MVRCEAGGTGRLCMASCALIQETTMDPRVLQHSLALQLKPRKPSRALQRWRDCLSRPERAVRAQVDGLWTACLLVPDCGLSSTRSQ